MTLERQTSHTTKVYEEGRFHEGKEIDASLNTPNQSINLGNAERKPTDNFPNDVIASDHGYQSGSGRSSVTTHPSTG